MATKIAKPTKAEKLDTPVETPAAKAATAKPKAPKPAAGKGIAAKVAAAKKAAAKPAPAAAKAAPKPKKVEKEEAEEIPDAETPEDTKKAVAAAKAKKPKTNYHHLYFCEPCSLDLKELSQKTVGSMKGELVNVTEDFYAVLAKAPKKYGGTNGNAYLFGQKFPNDEYKEVQSHESESLQTGLVDFDLLEEVPDIEEHWSECFTPVGWEWENRAALKKLRKFAPFVLFLGTTGEKGAKLYAHYSTADGGAKQVDSLIIDNGHFF